MYTQTHTKGEQLDFYTHTKGEQLDFYLHIYI